MNEPADTTLAAPPLTVPYAGAQPGVPSTTWRHVVAHLCAAAVAGMFIWYAVPKIQYPKQFQIDTNNYKILSKQASGYLAIVLPWWEVGAAIALLVPRTRRAGAILVTGMLIVFIVAIAIAMSKGLDISCGCGGKGHSEKAGWMTIGRDVLFLLGTALAVWLPPRAAAKL